MVTESGSGAALLGKSRNELRELVEDCGEPLYRGDQIAQWLYAKKVESIDAMANLPQALRERLKTDYVIGRISPSSVSESEDGTKKYLYQAASGFVEAAYIPGEGRATLCLSTQIGCRMGCRFCMTGRQGFTGNLPSEDIVNQYLSLPERETVTNIVYMGMGEPLDNVDEVLRSLSVLSEDWGLGIGRRRITVSTIGIIPGLKRFLTALPTLPEPGPPCRLAISLHSPFDEERRRLMPMQKMHPIREVLDIIKRANPGRSHRVSFEYIVFRGLNHSNAHAKALVTLLQGIRCRVNLIPFHRIPDAPYEPAAYADVVEVQNSLKEKGLPTTIRQSRGEDIQAACGMLSTAAR